MLRLPSLCALSLAVSFLVLSLGGCTPQADSSADNAKVLAPVFDPGSCAFWDAATVFISCPTAGAVIRYTTDGSAPSPSSGTIYTGPIPLAHTTTVQAIAYADGRDPSKVVSATYTRNAPDVAVSIALPNTQGSLFAATCSSLTISCMASADGGFVQSVTADLSQVGGPPAQSLTLFQDQWLWLGPVTPGVEGARNIVLTAKSNTGQQAIANILITVKPTNLRPIIADTLAIGDLSQRLKSALMVTCTANDPDGKIKTATVDLSAVGGSSATPMFRSGDLWSAYDTVTPQEVGDQTVVITMTDDNGDRSAASAPVTVSPVNLPPTCTKLEVSGSLVSGQPAAITVACTADDADGTVASVTADLSQIGGASDQALAPSGNRWVWSGTLTPPAAGLQTVTFVAADELGATVTCSAPARVITPPLPAPGQSKAALPAVSQVAAVCPLVYGQPNAVTFTCTTDGGQTAVQSVVADLSSVGGSSAQPLTQNGNSWTWTGTVSPSQSGASVVTVTTTNQQGQTAVGTAAANVITSEPGALAGTWSGNVNYKYLFSISRSSKPGSGFTLPLTQAFHADYTPKDLPLFFLMRRYFRIPASTLQTPGDQGTFVVQGPASELNPCTLTATVRNLSRSATAYSADMDLTLSFPRFHGPFKVTYHWDASLDASDHLLWSENISYDLGLLQVTAWSSTTLTRQ